MSRIIRTKQGSDLWLASRVGRVTGSRLGDVMAPPTTRASTRKGISCPAGTEALARAEYRQELIVGRIYGRSVNHYVTQAMQDGIDREPYARMLYEAATMQVVEQVGFALHPEWDWFGVSVDGLCGDDGIVEFKGPTEMVHDSYVANVGVLAEDYKWQCLAALICFPGRKWCDLVSFNPFAPDSIKQVKFRFHVDDFYGALIPDAIKAAEAFNEEIEAEIARRGLPPTVFDIMPEETE